MKVTKDEFEKKFDDLCEKERLEKKHKKSVFTNNIKDHIVVTDEYGNIINSSDLPKTSKKSRDRTYVLFLILITLIIFLLSKYDDIVYIVLYFKDFFI